MKRSDDVNPDDGDGYDPFANRPPGPLTSDFAALMHLLKTAIGTGVLFMPNAFRRNGFVMSIICSLCMSFLIIHTVVTLVRSAQLLCRRYRIPKLDFANTVEMSFQSGPEKMRKYGRHFGIFSNVIVCFVQIQAAVIYILYVSTSFQQVIEYYSGASLDVRVYVLAVFPIFLSFGFVPNLKYLAPISIVGTIFIFTGICVTLHYLLTDFPDPARLKMFTSAAAVPLYCTLFMFAMHNVTLCMPLENSMKNPGHLPRLIVINMLFTMCLNTTFGFFGYNKYMDKTCDTVIKNLPMDHALAQFIKITISLSVICTFGVGFYVTFSIIWPMLKVRYEEYKYASYLFRLIAVSLFFLVAISVPQMVPLLGFLTAFSITTIMLLIPILTETMTKWQTASRFLLAKNAGISIVWITLLIFGAIESMRTIIREYGSVKEEGC